MAFGLNPPLVTKNGHTLEVIIAGGRVSDPGPGKQSILSLDDQESMHMECLNANTDLPLNVTVVAGSGSGEILDREEYLRLDLSRGQSANRSEVTVLIFRANARTADQATIKRRRDH
jgi:hypothetical protein